MLLPFGALTLLLGITKSILPVKIEGWGVGVVVCLSEVQIVCIWPSRCHCIPKPIVSCFICPVWAREHCRISPPRFLAECCKRQLNQGSFVLLYFRLFTFSDLYWVCLSVFSGTFLFASISQVIGCEDRLRNDLYCVGWGVKLYSLQLASFIFRLVLPFFYRLTQVVLEKRPLNGCSSSSSTPWVKKTRHQTLAHNFTKYEPIFKILSLLDSVGNL